MLTESKIPLLNSGSLHQTNKLYLSRSNHSFLQNNETIQENGALIYVAVIPSFNVTDLH